MRYILQLVVIVLCVPIMAQQDVAYPEPIIIENGNRLQSVKGIDFADDNVNSGWFVLSNNLEHVLFITSDQSVQIAAVDNSRQHVTPVRDLIDAVPFDDNYFALLYTTETGFGVSYTGSFDNQLSLTVSVLSDRLPSALWVVCDAQVCQAFVETFSEDGTFTILEMPEFDLYTPASLEINVDLSELKQYPYAPAQDEDAVVRIGRIPLPYVVTSSLEGFVQLWHLGRDELIYDVDNGTGEPSVFGNINAGATHLVWRDNANETLYLLNFETGENREIDALNGEYAQWYFLSNDASVIIAVNLGGEPNIVVWDTTTGERTILGEYRDCNRPQPDMVRLSPDGSTLVIGCDTGLDIWQITEDN